ncbi:MAG: glycosyltransferase family 1 protein, partial [bacterium]|nr:glycosyltransferase family 1 protein [bacterium]
MNVMRRIDREKYRFHFCLTKDKPAEYDDEIRDLGGELIPCALNGGLWAYTRRLGAVLRDGRYDVVHSHMYTFSGVVLRVARKHGVAHRYAHLHTSADDQRNTVARKVYRRAMRWLVRRHGTRVLACAGWVMTNFVGEGWQGDPTRTVVYYGINLDPFAAPADPDGVRAEFGLASGCPLLIHVGRFITAKNHRKLIDVFRAMHAQRPEARLMLVGDGELMDDTRAQVRDYGLDEYIHFTGVRSDVARLMKAADVLVMPSVREGMP